MCWKLLGQSDSFTIFLLLCTTWGECVILCGLFCMSTCHSFKKLKRKLDFFLKMQEDLSSLRTLGTGDEGDTCVEKSTMGRDQASQSWSSRDSDALWGTWISWNALWVEYYCEDEALNDKNWSLHLLLLLLQVSGTKIQDLTDQSQKLVSAKNAHICHLHLEFFQPLVLQLKSWMQNMQN